MNYATNRQLMKLLPKLSALTDLKRLEVLGDIDRVLAANRMTWSDVAEKLARPRDGFESETVLAMIETIIKHPTEALSDNAHSFLEDTRARASGTTEVSLTPRQADWLHALHDRAEKEKAAHPALRIVEGGEVKELPARSRRRRTLATSIGGDAA